MHNDKVLLEFLPINTGTICGCKFIFQKPKVTKLVRKLTILCPTASKSVFLENYLGPIFCSSTQY